jgi:hypothetical protein
MCRCNERQKATKGGNGFAAICRVRFAAGGSNLSDGRHSPCDASGLTQHSLESGFENVFQKIFQSHHATGSCNMAWTHTTMLTIVHQ